MLLGLLRSERRQRHIELARRGAPRQLSGAAIALTGVIDRHDTSSGSHLDDSLGDAMLAMVALFHREDEHPRRPGDPLPRNPELTARR